MELQTGECPGKAPSGVQLVHKFQARNGGPGMWVDLPVCVLAPTAHKDEVNRAERL